MNNDKPWTFGTLLHYYRQQAGLSQPQLAERTGITDRQVRNLESNCTREPRMQTVQLLARALDLTQADRTRLITAARSTAPTPACIPASESEANSFVAPAKLIGRDRDIETVHRFVLDPTKRLITLTGPGGVGKTALAAFVARQAAPSFPDEYTFVALDSIHDAALVPSVIAGALGVVGSPRRTIEQTLVNALRTRRSLLVLDNFEHVLGAADVVNTLLHSCPHLTLLVTSRASLQLRGSQDVPIYPLQVPALDHGDVPKLLQRVPAVALFLDRANASLPDFALTEHNAEAVAQICRRLDGLPLAIELAAARIATLSPAQLLRRLDDSPSALAGGVRDLPARQRTLHDAIAWSYDLLEDHERTLLQWLTVFESGCTLEAAEAVCAPVVKVCDGPGPLEGVLSLVDKSLLVIKAGRVTLLQTIREFAASRLLEDGGGADARRRHVAYYRVLAEPVVLDFHTHDRRTLELLDEENDNLRAALSYAAEMHDVDAGLRIAVALTRFWFVRGMLTEGERWLTRLIDEADHHLDHSVSPELHTMALCLLGRMVMDMGDYGRAKQIHQRGLVAARSLGQPALLAATLSALAGAIYFQDGDSEQATRLSREALALRKSTADMAGQSNILKNLGNIAAANSNDVEAAAYFADAISMARHVGLPSPLAHVLIDYADILYLQGRAECAVQMYIDGLSLARQVGDRTYISAGLAGLSLVAHLHGDDAQAQRYCDECLAVTREQDNVTAVKWALLVGATVACGAGFHARAAAFYHEFFATLPRALSFGFHARVIESLANLACITGHTRTAARMYGAATALRVALKTPPAPVELIALRNLKADLQQRLDTKSLTDMFQMGENMLLDQVTADAVRLCDAIKQAASLQR